jgi:hypothetical protein
MGKTTKKDLMMITLDKAIDLYLATLETEGKSPRYVDWLKTRLRFFLTYMIGERGAGFKMHELTVDDGRSYIRHLMDRNTVYQDHPYHKEKEGKLKIQYIHGLGRAVRSFSTWA